MTPARLAGAAGSGSLVATMAVSLNWGIVATGGIARAFAAGVAHSKLGRVAAVGSRSPDSARKFAAEFGIPRTHGSYDALFADREIDAVYVATPHPQHVDCIVRAARAGKHVLCEKPLALTRADALRAADACRANDVLLMEAFMYRCHPQTEKVVQLVRDGALGQVRLVQATFSFATSFDPTNRFFNQALGGGGILDVGCYPVSFARLIAGIASGQPFLDPVHVSGAVQRHPDTGVDLYTAATLQFSTGLIAQVSTGVALCQDSAARIYGTEGWLHVPNPWVPAREGGRTTFYLHRGGNPQPEEIAIETDRWLYGLEADAFAATLAAGARDVPQMPVADTLGNMAVLDAWQACPSLS